MILYILAGLVIGFYITMTSVYPSILQARKNEVNNTFTENALLAIALNIVFLTIIWPVVLPYFFSDSFRASLKRGFNAVIYAED